MALAVPLRGSRHESPVAQFLVVRCLAMRCIFCKSNSEGSVSVEHVIPESLGNEDHILPRGWVCDGCNNYLATKVEKPFLDSLYGRSSRSSMGVPNKRGRIPPAEGWHAQSRTRVELVHVPGEGMCVGAAPGEDASRWVESFQTNTHGTLYIPTPDTPEPNGVTARFIAKVALEVLALRCADVTGWNDELVDKPELDELRRYVRRGIPNLLWPVHIRRLYAQDFLFPGDAHGPHQVLHEFDILHTPEGEYFVVVAIFGLEYTINVGGPELDGYHAWLKSNGDKSPLYK